MNKKKEFREMLDQILIEIIKVETSSKHSDLPVLTRNVINMLRNLNHQMEDQQVQIDSLEKELQMMRSQLILLSKKEKTKLR
jgi:hypothetical protein